MKEIQEKLFPYFAYKKSNEINPEKYGSVTDMNEWVTLIQKSPEDMELITKAAAELTEQDWKSLEEEYNQIVENSQAQKAAKGAKLKKLRSIKKKKCSCGCDLEVKKSAKGGLIEVCSCGCGGK